MAQENTEQKQQISPSQYFDYLKGAKNTITLDALKESFDVFIKLADKYQKLGQVESLKKLTFLADTLVKEEKIIQMGITTYVYKDVVEDYIDHVADKTVKIVELSRYMREVPDELVDVVDKTKDIFDQFYVVFTDYTGKEERKVEKERRDKDPILFGVFKNNTTVSDRFYFLGDWVDEYCDLTLDKMVEQYKEKNGYAPTMEIAIPENSEQLVELLKTYKIDEKGKDSIFVSWNEATANPVPVESYKADVKKPESKGFFDRVRSVFKKNDGQKN